MKQSDVRKAGDGSNFKNFNFISFQKISLRWGQTAITHQNLIRCLLIFVYNYFSIFSFQCVWLYTNSSANPQKEVNLHSYTTLRKKKDCRKRSSRSFFAKLFYILIDILPRLRILEFEKVPSESRDKKVMTAYYKLQIPLFQGVTVPDWMAKGHLLADLSVLSCSAKVRNTNLVKTSL